MFRPIYWMISIAQGPFTVGRSINTNRDDVDLDMIMDSE